MDDFIFELFLTIGDIERKWEAIDPEFKVQFFQASKFLLVTVYAAIIFWLVLSWVIFLCLCYRDAKAELKSESGCMSDENVHPLLSVDVSGSISQRPIRKTSRLGNLQASFQ